MLKVKVSQKELRLRGIASDFIAVKIELAVKKHKHSIEVPIKTLPRRSYRAIRRILEAESYETALNYRRASFRPSSLTVQWRNA